MRLLALICAAALAATSSAEAAAAHWIGSWGASPAPPMPPAPGGGATRFLVPPGFNNQTIVQIVRLSAGGQRLRLRLSNEYGPKPMEVGAAKVALVGADGAVVPGSERAVTFSAAKAATIPAGAPLVSDPVALPTKTMARLRISLYLPGEATCTCHATGLELVQTAPGDATEKALPRASGEAQYRAFLTGVEVETTAAPAPVIVAFGDSITDGYQSTTGANRRWPDRLEERLMEKSPGRAIGIHNAGISGNRVLSGGMIAVFGESALTRFDRDVLSVPGATHVVVLEGVNDLGASRTSPPSAEALIAGYRQIIARGHAHGLKVIGATILPYGGAGYFAPPGEAVRTAVNAWIRTFHEFDGVIDFDAAIRDPAKPERMKAEWQSGDWLHPNDAGYRVMGDAVDLNLFR